MRKIDLKSMSIEELQKLMVEWKYPAFRGKQIFQWLHEKKVNTFEEMGNIPKTLREDLEEHTRLDGVELVEKLVSQRDGTRKYLFALSNDCIIESVFMKYEHGNTVCVSVQAGCRMGCKFCASTIDGVECNLTAGEMLSQVYEIEKDCGERVHGVVLMGSGEPLDNYDSTVKFIRLINDPKGHNMGQRHITLSTCGLIEKINMLAKENLQITLAISLHAPDNEIRKQIMPVAKGNPMDALLDACEKYTIKTGRRITFEYAMMAGVNDSEACAKGLAMELKNMLCHVNLIPVNEVKESAYTKSSVAQVKNFASILHKNGIEATIRRKLGSDIEAACGQLRRGYLNRS